MNRSMSELDYKNKILLLSFGFCIKPLIHQAPLLFMIGLAREAGRCSMFDKFVKLDFFLLSNCPREGGCASICDHYSIGCTLFY